MRTKARDGSSCTLHNGTDDVETMGEESRGEMGNVMMVGKAAK
jgi:hypothetical protein